MVDMSLPLSTSSTRRHSKANKLWPIHADMSHDETTQQQSAESAPTTLDKTGLIATEEKALSSTLTDTSPILHCCKDDDNRKGTCCRELKPSDQRTLIDPDIIRDVIIGLSDGLTVPFALTAGLSSVGSSHFVVLAGVAELISGAISMGVGGYLSTQAEIEHYQFRAREISLRVQKSCPKELTDEIADILEPYGAPYKVASSLSAHLWEAEKAYTPARPPPSILSTRLKAKTLLFWRNKKNTTGLSQNCLSEEDEHKGLTQFLVRVGGGLEPISPSRAYTSALTIGFSYLAGGLVPLLPYIIIKNVHTALFVSIGITAAHLVVFGIVKQHYSGARTGFRGYTYGAVSTLLVGGVAAAASWGIVRAIESHSSSQA